MRIGIVVDSGCDLPPDYIERHGIRILPITIHLDGRDLVDVRDPASTLDFYRRRLGEKGDAATSPLSVEEIRDVFLRNLVTDYDFVFCLTIASSRSPIYANAVQASFAILSQYKPIRAEAGISGPFALRVLDSQNLFSAQAVPVLEAVRMIAAGELNPNRIRERLEQIIHNTYGYLIPRDLQYLRLRAKRKGDRSVGLFGALLGTALDIKPVVRGYRNETGPIAKLRHFDDAAERLFEYTVERIDAGLMSPAVCLSYGGDLAVMRRLPGYAALAQRCTDRGIELCESLMSMTAGINVGDGALAVAFAAEEHEVDL